MAFPAPMTYSLGRVISVQKNNEEFDIKYDTKKKITIRFLNDHVFRYYLHELDTPTQIYTGDYEKIFFQNEKVAFQKAELIEDSESYKLETNTIKIIFKKSETTMVVVDKRTDRDVICQSIDQQFDSERAHIKQTLVQRKDEYFFGGGMQCGRFSHKGSKIRIAVSDYWQDGGVASPCPFFWSTYGYGVLRNTNTPGIYDFRSKDIVTASHETSDFDAYYIISPLPKDILKEYYKLTGSPILLPEYAFYEGHLNSFNDFWIKTNKSNEIRVMLFEDGCYYQRWNDKSELTLLDKNLESLNGDNDNYQFSARAVIDRYKKNDFPLGWILPDNIEQTIARKLFEAYNWKEFVNYARKKGVEVLQFNIPNDDLERVSEMVEFAGIVGFKCYRDTVHKDYTDSLIHIERVPLIKNSYRDVRTLVISLNGWAGTQRYSAVHTGAQCGGKWENIRIQIPTLIGAGLSGLPFVGSDVDGSYGGGIREVNIREFQWKTFTPLQMTNNERYYSISKNPFSLDEETSAINRAYLKMKSMLMPYNYSVGHESTQGLPMIRAMFLEFPKEVAAYTNLSDYQFMWGPSILVAPIYNSKGYNDDDSIRDGIYLPDKMQVWIDFFTGEKYQGGKIYNNIKTPLWKSPVFIRDGAIIPMTNANNNPNEIQRDIRIFTIYPNGKTSFTVYEDDGISSQYLKNHFATTKIDVTGPPTNSQGNLTVEVNKTEGAYHNMVKERSTILQIMASKDVNDVEAIVNGTVIQVHRVESKHTFLTVKNIPAAIYFENNFALNEYFDKIIAVKEKQKCLVIKFNQLDVKSNKITVKIKDYINEGLVYGSNDTLNNNLEPPENLVVLQEDGTTSLHLKWNEQCNARYYEIQRDGVIFTNITGTSITFTDYKYDTIYRFRIRSVNKEEVSEWTGVAIVAEGKNPEQYKVKGVNVSCSLPSHSKYDITKLIDGDMTSIWLVTYNKQIKDIKTIDVNFDLGAIYQIKMIEYYPRQKGDLGNILSLCYKHSIDGVEWSDFSGLIEWKRNRKVKVLRLNIKMRYMQWSIYNSVYNGASGCQVIFYKDYIDEVLYKEFR